MDAARAIKHDDRSESNVPMLKKALTDAPSHGERTPCSEAASGEGGYRFSLLLSSYFTLSNHPLRSKTDIRLMVS